MIIIQSNILEELRCNKCNEYLSYAPIMITEDGENVCGRCVNDNLDIKLIRYKAYEALAAIAAFPCRYKGCAVIIPWEDVIVHEDHCEYRLTECPKTPQGTCKWKGPLCTLMKHYTETHPDLILKHPCSLDADILVDTDKNMMFSFSGFEFLVQIRCNTALSKLWHCVHCFAMPQVAQQFNFCVEFSSDEGSFKKEKPVLTEKCLTMQIDKSIETKVKSLLELLADCNCINIKVVLSILPKVNYDLRNVFLCVECKDPSLPAVFRNHDKYYCLNCKLEPSFHDRNKENLFGKILNKCKNNNAGCPYFHISKKLMYRHETWECKWQKKCFFGCDINFDELQTHFVKKAHNSILQINLDIDCWHYGQIKKNNNIFICKCFINQTCIKVYIYSQLPIQDIHLYKCEIKFDSHFGSKFILTYNPTGEHDWEIHKTYLEKNPNPLCITTKSYIFDITISK